MRIGMAELAVLAMLTACGEDASGPPAPPPKPNISGTWRGTATGASGNASNITVTLLHDTIANMLGGSGNFVQGTASLALSVSGTYANTSVSLIMSAPGFQALNFTGTHATTSIAGTLNGSGFTNTALTLTK